MSIRGMRWGGWLLWVIGIGLTVWGCSDENPENRSGAGSPGAGSANIGTDGGAVTSADGMVTLTVPAGALGTTETIVIRSIHPASLPPELAGAELAWELRPDGLQFAQPVQVSVTLPEFPAQADGNFRVPFSFLRTLAGAAPEALGNQTLTVDGEANRAAIDGTLTHFSPLAVYSSLTDSSAGIPGKIFLELIPLPEKITVGQQYRADLQVSVDGLDEEAPVAGSFDYRDRSPAPLKHLPLGDPDSPGFRALQGFSPLPSQGAFVLDGIGSYLCEAAAPAAIFSLDVRPALETSGRFLTPDLLITFLTTHTCAAPTLLPAPEAEVITVPFSQPEAVFNLSRAIPPPFLSLFGLDENRAYATVGHHPGMSILDLTTNRVVLTKALEPDGLGPLLGAVAHLRDGRGCLFGYRERRFLSCRIPEINDFGPPESSDDGPYHDAGLVAETPVETPSGTRHLLWFVEADRVHQEHQPGGRGSLIFERKLERAWFATGGPPTGNAKSAFFTGGGARMLALVARGEPSGPGQLWWGNPAELGGGTFVGTLENDTRKIRCKIPICAVSHFSGRVTILVWDGITAPRIIDAIPETTNAVGIDVRAAGGDREILSTDFVNNNWTLTRVGPTGQILSSATRPVPEGCTNPGHALFVTDPQTDQLSAVLSCNGVNAEGQSAIAKIPLP